MAPRQSHALIPGPCDSVTVHGKKDSADAMKLRMLRRGDYLGYGGGGAGNVIT